MKNSHAETGLNSSNNQSETRSEELELINGEFSMKDAKEILLQLFGDKIKYHQLRNLSSLERFGEFDKISTRRLPELQMTEKRILNLFKDDAFFEGTIKIQATINIEIAE
ncbi:hypothetical protein [Aquiflexum lacus]|uniref:hypothetical protein n=1 Tax=Aquiflexum lacus TaxID=2483805 RepID=UPI0018945E48|nr:hypothetical protein [Aquiflexum lacus]